MKTEPAGFSLVEVVLALGIVSFALVALLGLFSVGLGASKRSGEDTEVANMSAQIVSTLRNRNSAYPTTATFYFDTFGRQTNLSNTNIGYYQCVLTTTTSPAISSDSASLVQAKMTFTWPCNATKRTTNILYATFPPQ